MTALQKAALATLLSITISFAFAASPARADGGGAYDPDPNAPTTTGVISVVSSQSGVTIFIAMSETRPGQAGTPGSTQVVNGPAVPSCAVTPMNIGNASAGWVRDGLAANPDTVPWTVSCSNGYFGIAWVPANAPVIPAVVITNPGTPAVDPVALAASVLGTVPLPPITVGASPGVGLVAMPSWFWIGGYDGAPLYGSRTLGLVTVEVEITPGSYRWSFGDGAAIDTASLGSPYPIESDIQHVYERSSPVAGGVYDLRLEITFSAHYRVNGGAWMPLDPITQAYMREYPVRQLQSVLTSNR